ncbi:MAG TPA: LPXTG cell wall anchor domain-containing protein [Candidatus Saccharimonadales bacterium]|nr:LPXTG cell wall anchor domain-containing protein [Candidatus Saccharimonadales bacterium]
MKKLIIGLALVLTGVVITLTPSVNAANDSNIPGGNNGTVKISDESNPDGIPQNDPHVSCSFNVEFYNYDKGSHNATVDFNLQHPTAGNGYTLSATGNLSPIVNGGKGLDASEKYTLAFTGQAHPQQGYHVKLTVTVPKANGSEIKHKVFWVKPCTSSTSSPVTPPQILATSTTVNTPTSLPNTGAGSTIGLFAGVSVLAGLGHFIVSRRRA